MPFTASSGFVYLDGTAAARHSSWHTCVAPKGVSPVQWVQRHREGGLLGGASIKGVPAQLHQPQALEIFTAKHLSTQIQGQPGNPGPGKGGEGSFQPQWES